MKIAIIGSGFTGLSAAFELSKKGHQIVVFEKDKDPGGLALGYKEKGWQSTLEKHYHHWFTNDKDVLNLAKEINYPVNTNRPKTSIYVNNKIYQFDSPLHVLKFSLLSYSERLRMGFFIAFLKFNPFWKPLEKFKATTILPKFMGVNSYRLIWKALFINKFGRFAEEISLAWFWARIFKRTPSLVYPSGGFLEFANALTDSIKKRGGKFRFQTEVLEIISDNKPLLKYKNTTTSKIKAEQFDSIIFTGPSYIFLKLAGKLPKDYQQKLQRLKHLGATSLILRLNKPFFIDNTYWLSICDSNSPIMAIVEHTNFVNNKNYNKEHILYLGNYKEKESDYFILTKEDLLERFDPFLKKINPEYNKNIIATQLFKDIYAQPVIPVNYSKILPPFSTPLKGVYLANIEQVYPWDRGTNYAVQLGKKISKLILKNDKN